MFYGLRNDDIREGQIKYIKSTHCDNMISGFAKLKAQF